MKLSAATLLGQLTFPGHTLALCDETDLTTPATSTMLANIHAWVALVMRSDTYGAMAETVTTYKRDHDLPELHGNEIVNPGSQSPWKAISIERRLAAFEFACNLAQNNAAAILYVHISKRQFEKIVAENPEVKLTITMHKAAVKKAFKHSLAKYLVHLGSSLVVFDKDKNTSGATLEAIRGATHLLGGGVLHAASEEVPGIQVVDVAAYSIGRYLRRRDALIAEKGNGFDKVAMTFVAQLKGRVVSIL